MAGGRPTEYRPEYSEQVTKLCILGATDKDIADFFNVSEQTVNAWKEKHPEFLESLKQGKIEADLKVANSLYKKARGGYLISSQKAFVDRMGEEHVIEVQDEAQPDTTACIFWLKNRQPDKWREKQEVQHSGEVKTGDIDPEKFEELKRLALLNATPNKGD